MNSGFIAFLKKIDHFLDRQTPILLLFALIVVLRLPNFFEPYWYGDEAIYLTLGNALRNGGELYTTIIDHKTPLIYYLAMVPNQFYFRILNLFWMLATTLFFFIFAKKLFKRERWAFLSTLIMVIFTTLPWLEGHIPNGELFVMGFVMAGAVLFSKSSIFQNFFSKTVEFTKNWRDNLLLLGSGFFMGLGMLTKVPALLDVAAFLSIFWLILISQFFNEKNNRQKFAKIFSYLFGKGLVFVFGLVLPIVTSILYFVMKGHGQDYLDYGLLYNFRYSQSWPVDLGNNIVNFAFSMPGKTILLLVIFLLVSLNGKQLGKRLQFISLYFIFTLYSVLLSSRPYPHYFIQMVPAFALLFTQLCLSFGELRQKKSFNTLKSIVLGLGLMSLTAYVMISFKFMPYSTLKYYQQFYRFATLQISKEEYENSFDGVVQENREITKMIKEMGVKKMFIWGTNPLLYAQSQTIPTSRFTVSFHIKDFNDYERTFAQIEAEEPKLIIVMNNEDQKFEALENYLATYYLANNQFEKMTLYLRQ